MISQESPLLLLPAELRNRVYRLVLIGGIIEVDQESISDITALLKVCRAARIEGESIFFAENRFQAHVATDHYTHIVRWLQVLPLEHATWLKKLEIRPAESTLDIRWERRLIAEMETAFSITCTTPHSKLVASRDRTIRRYERICELRQIMAIDLARDIVQAGIPMLKVRSRPNDVRPRAWTPDASAVFAIDLILRQQEVKEGWEHRFYASEELRERAWSTYRDARDRTDAAAAKVRGRLDATPERRHALFEG